MPFGFTLCNALDCFEIPQKAKQKLFTTEQVKEIENIIKNYIK